MCIGAMGPQIIEAEESHLPQAACARVHWYAAYTCAHHEKRVAQQLAQRSIEYFLPLYQTLHRWKDRRVGVKLPLFPGYVFVRLALGEHLSVLRLPSVVRLVSFCGTPAPLPEGEIEALRERLNSGVRAEPCAYLKVGRRVRVKCGPLIGMEGILLRRKSQCRIVLSINLILRSIALEVNQEDVEPVRGSSRAPNPENQRGENAWQASREFS
jgi:transcription antitermination factor NusG